MQNKENIFFQTARGSSVIISEESRRKSEGLLMDSSKEPVSYGSSTNFTESAAGGYVSAAPSYPCLSNPSQPSYPTGDFTTPLAKPLGDHCGESLIPTLHLDRDTLLSLSDRCLDMEPPAPSAAICRFKQLCRIDSGRASRICFDENGRDFSFIGDSTPANLTDDVDSGSMTNPDYSFLLISDALRTLLTDLQPSDMPEQPTTHIPLLERLLGDIEARQAQQQSSSSRTPLSKESREWLAQQARWVVWTLASYERKQPARFLGSLLTYGNVLAAVNDRYVRYTKFGDDMGSSVTNTRNLVTTNKRLFSGTQKTPAGPISGMKRSRVVTNTHSKPSAISSETAARPSESAVRYLTPCVRSFNARRQQSPLQRCADIRTLLWPLVLCFSLPSATTEVSAPGPPDDAGLKVGSISGN